MSPNLIVALSIGATALTSTLFVWVFREKPWWREQVIITRLTAAICGFALGTFISVGLFLGSSAVDDAAQARDKLQATDQHLAANDQNLKRAIDRVVALENPTRKQIQALFDRLLKNLTEEQRRQLVDVVQDVRAQQRDVPQTRGETLVPSPPRARVVPPQTVRPVLPPVRVPPFRLPQPRPLPPLIDPTPPLSVPPITGLPPIEIPPVDSQGLVQKTVNNVVGWVNRILKQPK